MAKNYTYKLQADGRDSWVCNDTDTGEAQMVYEKPLMWRGLVEDLYSSITFTSVLMGQTQVNPIAYSTLIKVLTDGENGNSNQATLLVMLNALNANFSQNQKDEINAILKNNLFEIQL